ncbi:MAG TPA: hydroxymethylbilane synthase [Chthoniobacterales bacterium]|nr:hydroxymethylbilane synthase [Chthoniobacterales bacterium]
MSASRLSEIVLGSRGSELARTQTALAVERLRRAWPDLKLTASIISTRGDMRTAEPIDSQAGRKGLFTGEIERALLAGEIDVAVHSAKDLPSEMTPGLCLGAVLPRASIEDVLIARNGAGPRGKIATGSVRRRHQLLWKFPDVEVVDLRGNVPTRLRKFLESDWQAIVLARAGLERLGYEVGGGAFDFEGVALQAEKLSADVFLPAGGQGIIALQIRNDDGESKASVNAVNHEETFACLEAEREFLRLLHGDCGSPVGVLATIAGGAMTVRAQVFEPARVEPRAARVDGASSAPKKLARELWEKING